MTTNKYLEEMNEYFDYMLIDNFDEFMSEEDVEDREYALDSYGNYFFD